ncbi:uncharacterized protein LOC142341173 [Convolutriloba macropyga]|uniref:uncharacterized protein LOC142341173 n=1 Tax=Convolutriloba macropyga TaxID=536237 RepID=UPI003F520A6B
MVNRWDFAAVAFLVIFSTFLINLVVQDAIALVQTLGEPQSQLNFKKATGNVHSPALISFRGFKLGGISVPLHYYCSCTLRRVKDQNYVRNCSGTPYPIFTSMVGIGSKSSQTYWDNFWEVPGDRGQGDYLKYDCFHPGVDGLSIASTPFGAGMARFYEAASFGEEYINQFYERHFINRPLPYNPSGHYNTILLEKQIFLGIGEVASEVNTLIIAQASRTSHINESYTEFKIAWASDTYLLVQEVQLGSALLVFTVIAVPSLLVERLITLFGKLKRKGEFFNGVRRPPTPPPEPLVARNPVNWANYDAEDPNASPAPASNAKEHEMDDILI